MEDKPLPFVGIDRLPLGFLEKLFGKREIALLQQPEEGVLLPFRSVEAPVGLGAFLGPGGGGSGTSASALSSPGRWRSIVELSVRNSSRRSLSSARMLRTAISIRSEVVT